MSRSGEAAARNEARGGFGNARGNPQKTMRRLYGKVRSPVATSPGVVDKYLPSDTLNTWQAATRILGKRHIEYLQIFIDNLGDKFDKPGGSSDNLGTTNGMFAEFLEKLCRGKHWGKEKMSGKTDGRTPLGRARPFCRTIVSPPCAPWGAAVST